MDTLSFSLHTVHTTCDRMHQIRLEAYAQYRFYTKTHLLLHLQSISRLKYIFITLCYLPERPSFDFISVLHVKHIFILLPQAKQSK